MPSESGIIATLLKHPDFVFYAEDYLKPEYFTQLDNKCVYVAVLNLARKGIYKTDPYNIIAYLNSSVETKAFAERLSIDKLNELVEVSTAIARETPEEYKMLADNVTNAAFRRFTYGKLRECESMLIQNNTKVPDIEQRIYSTIDDVMMEFATTNDVPQYKDIIDDCWQEIKSRQKDGYAGIPFKFKTLNEFVTLEKGELVIFAANAKEGKSMMLLNCAIDLLDKDMSVLYIDSELNSRLFTARVLAHLSGVEYKRLTSGNYTPEEAREIDKAREWMKTRKFTHIYMPMFDTQSMYSAVKKTIHTTGLDVLIVDYFKGSGEGDAFNSYQELGRVTDFVKNSLAGKLGLCALGAAQATNDGRIADSAKIGRNASTIAIITPKTADEIAADGPECGNKKLRVVLNRNGPQHASDEYIDLRFDGDHVLYEEAKQHVPVMPY